MNQRSAESAPPPHPLAHHELIWLIAIVAVGFALRLAWALTVHSGIIPDLDMQAYYAASQNFADGYGLTTRFVLGQGHLPGPGGAQAITFPPGYALTLGAAFKVFGTSLLTGKLLNVVAGSLTLPLVYVIAWRPFGGRTALIATAVCALYPANIFWTSILYSELLFTLPFTLAIAMAASRLRRGDARWPFLIGLCLGYATVIRSEAAILVPVFLIYWIAAAFEHPGRRVLVLLLGMAIWIAPLAAWNTARAGHVVLISQNLGYNLRIGHSPTADGRYTATADVNQPDLSGNPPPGEWELARRAISYAATHPAREMELSLRKAYFLYITDASVLGLATTSGADPLWDSERLSVQLGHAADVSSYVLLALALASLPLTVSRRDERLLLWLVVMSWTATHIIFFGAPRYRLPLLPILSILAAVSLRELWVLTFASKPADEAS